MRVTHGEEIYARVRLTQSRLETALSSVNAPSSYRLKQIGDTAEGWKGRIGLRCHSHLRELCAGFQEKHAHAHTVGWHKHQVNSSLVSGIIIFNLGVIPTAFLALLAWFLQLTSRS